MVNDEYVGTTVFTLFTASLQQKSFFLTFSRSQNVDEMMTFSDDVCLFSL